MIYFSESVLFFTAITCIVSSAFKDNLGVQILKKLHRHDQFVIKKFHISFSCKLRNLRIKKSFIKCVFLVILSYVWMTVELSRRFPSITTFLLYLSFLFHFVHIHCFIFHVFTTAIEDRLKLISQLADEESFLIKTALAQICELIELVNKYFRPTFIQTLSILHFTFINGIYCICASYLFGSRTRIPENLAYILPIVLILFAFARCDQRLEKHLKLVISRVLLSNASDKEDILIFWLKSFKNHQSFTPKSKHELRNLSTFEF